MKLLKTYLVVLSILFTSSFLFSQKLPEITHRKVRVNLPDTLIIAHVSLEKKLKTLNLTSNYYWYHNNTIKSNQGGYTGKLLDGEYSVIDYKDNLLIKGNLKDGLKHGVWKQWNKKGHLIETRKWIKGLQNGSYHLYKNAKLIEVGKYKKGKKNGVYKKFKDGFVIEKGYYKKGALHGKLITYKNDTIFSSQKFKNGKLLKPKEEDTKKKKPKEEKDENVKKDKKTTEKNSWWKIWKRNKKEKKVTTQKPIKKGKIPNKKRKEKIKKSQNSKNG